MKATAFLKDLFSRFVKSKWAWIALAYWLAHSVSYFVFALVIGKIPDSEVLLIHSPLDDAIPFFEWFVFPYVTWYLLLFFVGVRAFALGKRAFLRFHLLAVPCMLVSMIFFLFQPNGLPLSIRPDFDALGRNNLATWAVKLIYLIDSPPRVVMPSMHCSVSAVIPAFYFMTPEFRGRYGLKAAVTALCVLIILATVFIKQHSVLDLFAGVGFGLAVTLAVRLGEWIHDRRAARRLVNEGE